ncbi:MAG: GHMP kinase [Bacteroidetes bacterium]|nr:GHMP kinase [Bacteroidota bacterium]
MKEFYSNGKLLLTGEYVVLDGALSLAIPTKFGQSLSVKNIDESKLVWKSFDNKGDVWFEDSFLIKEIASVFSKPRNDVSKMLIEILNSAKQLNPNFLNDEKGYEVHTKLDFPKNWGLGSSSTLIHNIANWANVDAYQLLDLTFGGSGYDIACAQNDNAITYQLELNKEISQSGRDDKTRLIKSIEFNPSFKDDLYFVYLNQKQNSREGIKQYKMNTSNLSNDISEINDITIQMIDCVTLEEFKRLMNTHELIISRIIKQEPIKTLFFKDFKGSIKSLGAWGGDFILVASNENPKAYFNNKGFKTILNYSEMILEA